MIQSLYSKEEKQLKDQPCAWQGKTACPSAFLFSGSEDRILGEKSRDLLSDADKPYAGGVLTDLNYKGVRKNKRRVLLMLPYRRKTSCISFETEPADTGRVFQITDDDPADALFDASFRIKDRFALYRSIAGITELRMPKGSSGNTTNHK